MTLKTQALQTLEQIDEFRDITLQIPEENPCEAMLVASSEGSSLREVKEQANGKWLAAAEYALTEHKASFGMLSIDELLSERGLLSRLRELGYGIREP